VIVKVRPLPIYVIVLCLASAVCAQGQNQAQPASAQASTVDTQGIRNYLLGPGDVLHVKVFGQQELDSVADVDSEGNISSLPFIETPIPARCRTEKEVQKEIAIAYARLIKNPQVSVQIAERKSRQPVTVFGAVRTPTRVPMLRKVRLSELMAASGGFTDRASGTIQILHTEPLMCPATGEEAEAAPIDGANLPLEVVKIAELKAGKPQANPFIRPGDYISVTEAEPVYITGSVVSPQGVYARDQLTLSTALAMVGGVKKEAKVDEVLIHRLRPGSSQRDTIRVDLAAIKKSRQSDVLLQAYDWVEVPEAGVLAGGRLGTTLLDVFTRGLQSIITPRF
jgi:polysaccharide biosynthesis/export protein